MLIVRVDDNGAAQRAVAALREIEKQIPKSIRDIRRDAFKDAAKTAKGNLGGGGSLRGPIARGTKAAGAGDESSLISNKVVSPRGEAYNLPAAVNASNRYMVDSYRKSYSSGWRHPLYGNRSYWVTQQSPSPGWFTNALAGLPKSQTEAALLASELGKAWKDVLEEAAEYVAART